MTRPSHAGIRGPGRNAQKFEMVLFGLWNKDPQKERTRVCMYVRTYAALPVSDMMIVCGVVDSRGQLLTVSYCIDNSFRSSDACNNVKERSRQAPQVTDYQAQSRAILELWKTCMLGIIKRSRYTRLWLYHPPHRPQHGLGTCHKAKTNKNCDIGDA